MLNKALLIGRLGRDPEMRYTANGKAVTSFSIATDGYGNDAKPDWHDVVCWDKLAETCAQYLAKGRQVYVEGRLQTRSWDDKKSGEKRYRTEIVADRVLFLGSKDERPSGLDAPDQGDIDADNLPF